MSTLNQDYIKQTLKEERLWKDGEADSFSFNGWEITLKKEKGVYSVEGYKEDGSKISKSYETMEDAFSQILNL